MLQVFVDKVFADGSGMVRLLGSHLGFGEVYCSRHRLLAFPIILNPRALHVVPVLCDLLIDSKP